MTISASAAPQQPAPQPRHIGLGSAPARTPQQAPQPSAPLCSHGAAPAQCAHRAQHLQEVKARLLDVMLELELHCAPSARRAELEAEKSQLMGAKLALEGAAGAPVPTPLTPPLQAQSRVAGASPASRSFNPPLQQQPQAQSRFAASQGPVEQAGGAGRTAGGPGSTWQGGAFAGAPSGAPREQAPRWQPPRSSLPLPAPQPQRWGDAHEHSGGGLGSAWDSGGAGGNGAYSGALGDSAGDRVPDPALRQGSFSAGVEEVVECRQTEGASDSRWEGAFPWSANLARANEDFFANSAFRPNQRQAINATMAGKDVFVLMPTGGGAATVPLAHHMLWVSWQVSCQ